MRSPAVSSYEGLRIVIARYNEPIDWLPNIVRNLPGCKVTIYNKGPDDLGVSDYTIIKLPNVGRESHSYLTHIINNYQTMDDDVVVFLQAVPFDHCREHCREHCKCKEHPRDLDDLLRRIERSILQIISGSVFENIGTYLHKIVDGNPLNHPTIESELRQTSIDVLSAELPQTFEFSSGALIMVCSTSIFKRPLSFYKVAIEMLDTEVNPVRGFCFERLWSLIFTGSTSYY